MKIVVIFLITLFSCAPYNLEITNYEKNKKDLAWWKIFNDVELENIINEAVNKNLDIKIQRKNIEIARINYYIEQSSLFPELNLSGAGVRYKRYLRGLPEFIPSKIKESQYNLSIDLNYEIDFWRKNYLKTKSKKIVEIIENHKNEIIKKTLISNICSIFFEIKKNNSIKNIYNEILKLYKNEFDILKEKFIIGDLPIERLNEVKIKIEKIEENLILIQNSNNILTYSINVLMAKKPKNKIRIGEFKFVKISLPQNIESENLKRRPDVKIALDSIILNKQLLKIAKTSYFPQFYLTTSYGYENDKIKNLINNYNSLYNISLKFLQSIFDYGKRKNLVKISEKELEKSNIYFTNVILNALKEVHESISYYVNLTKKREKILNELNLLNNILLTSIEKFKKNLIPLEKIYELKVDILLKRIELLNTEKEIYDAIIKIYKALGF